MSGVCQQGNSCYMCKLRDQQCGWQVHNPACKTHACTHNESISVTLNQSVNTDKNYGFLKSHDSLKQRQRGGAGSTKKKHYMFGWQAHQSNPLAVQRCCFFCVVFFSQGPAFAIRYSNAEVTGGELLPDHPFNREGLVKEHQLGQQDAGPVHVQGGLESAHPHRSRPSLACIPVHTHELSLSLTHTDTNTHTQMSCSRTEADTYAVTCFFSVL